MESTSQVLLAIISVGVDPLTDQRFIKNGNTLIDGVLRYKLESGGFCHTFDYDPDNAAASNGVYNSMATDQGGYGLVAAWRYLNGMRYIYDYRAEFSAQDTSVINTLKTTIDNALAKKGTEGYYEALNSAMETYNSTFKELNDNSLRRYVPNYWHLSDALDAENAAVDELKKAAAPVEKLIAAIGTVTKDSKAAIEKARAAYDSLADAAKKYVSNYSVLTAAEKTLAELSKPVPPEVVKVTDITLEKSGISLYPTQAQLLKETVTPANAANKAVTYKSSNTKVVTVDANGKITAKAAGTAVITVTAQDGSGKSADCKVTVKKAKVKLNAATLPLQVKKRVTLKVSGLAAGDKVVSWKSSNKKYAVVSGKGKVTAKKPGKTIITVTTKYGAKATCDIKVQKGKVKATSISVNKKKLELKKGKKAGLVVTLKPITAKDKITFKSLNPGVAKVNSNGVVTAKKKGECKIIIRTSNGKKKTVKVNVINSSKK
ncbi:MAG: Ig-like domain-containing protein [Clostridiales bacterium]|nr:Ig-like domain-containing protein [Clostridiales bacterium]MDU3243486.1 Ig-like domain-containing protein [Clostridiales bacterium]